MSWEPPRFGMVKIDVVLRMLPRCLYVIHAYEDMAYCISHLPASDRLLFNDYNR
jgi:hypothetical protein